MFLSGGGGSGKSYTIFAIERDYHLFYQYVSILFEKKRKYLTTITDSAMIEGVTLYSTTSIEDEISELTI